MKRNSKKLSNQKYFVIERYIGREDWTTTTLFTNNEFDSSEKAFNAIRNIITQDPDFYCDLEYKIAAINDQVITVQTNTTHEVVVQKE